MHVGRMAAVKSSVGRYPRVLVQMPPTRPLEKETKEKMSRIRRTPEAQVLAYFRNAPLGEAEMVQGLVRDLMRERMPQKRKTPKSKAPNAAKDAKDEPQPYGI